MNLNLKGRVAVITGGAAGIGEAIASALAFEGCVVEILDLNMSAAANAAASLTERGLQARATAVDVGDYAAVAEAFRQIAGRAERMDILVNAAGLLSTGPVASLPAEEWDRISRVNVSGVLNCAKAAIPTMTRQGYGRIVNIASVSAMRGGGSVDDD